MRRFTFAGTCLLIFVLAISGHTVFGQSQQRGGSSSSSSNSRGSSSSSYGSSSNSRSTSSNSYGTSSSSYGTSRNSYRTSSNTHRTSRRTYGSSSGGQSRRPSSTSQRRVRRLKERSESRLYLPIILAGIVIIEGGGRPPEPVVVWINCGGQALPQAYTYRDRLRTTTTRRCSGQSPALPGTVTHLLAPAENQHGTLRRLSLQNPSLEWRRHACLRPPI